MTRLEPGRSFAMECGQTSLSNESLISAMHRACHQHSGDRAYGVTSENATFGWLEGEMDFVSNLKLRFAKN